MATYTEFHQPEIASDRQHQDVSISQILDHGSISFGRFAVDSLAWEKRSVFRHNRCQEELEMYKANGLVAQKKAYFEEYYKRVRALKALQAEHQETTQPDPSPNMRMENLQLENDDCDDLSKEERSRNDTVANFDSPLGSIVDKPGQAHQQPLNDSDDSTDKVIKTDETSKGLHYVKPEHATNRASLSPTPSVIRSSKPAQHDSHVSDPIKNDANKPKKHAPPLLKAKGNAGVPRNKSKLDCKITKDAVKSSEKSTPLLLHHINAKRDNNLLPSKSNTRRAASENNSNHVSSRKQLTEVCSSSTVLHPSSTRSRLVPSSPSGRSDQKKAHSNCKDLADRLRTSLPVHARCVQNPSKEKPVPGGLKNMAIEKRSCLGVSRKSLDLGNQQMRPKVDQSENQRPKSMFTNNPARNKSNQNVVVDYERKNYEKERKQKEGAEESNAAGRRYLKSASTVASSVQKNVKLVHKNSELRSGILPHA